MLQHLSKTGEQQQLLFCANLEFQIPKHEKDGEWDKNHNTVMIYDCDMVGKKKKAQKKVDEQHSEQQPPPMLHAALPSSPVCFIQ